MARPNLQALLFFLCLLFRRLVTVRDRISSGYIILGVVACRSLSFHTLLSALSSWIVRPSETVCRLHFTYIVRFCFVRRCRRFPPFSTKFNLIFIRRSIILYCAYIFMPREIKYLGDNMCHRLCKMDIGLCSYFRCYRDSTAMLMTSCQSQYACFAPRIMVSVVIKFSLQQFLAH